MDNEFGYLDIKPFDKINEEQQKLAIINQKENKLELKIKDVEKFSTFNFYGGNFGKLIETKTFYGINSTYNPLTLYHCSVESSSLKVISHSIVTSKMYIIGNYSKSPIIHFTDKTKVKSINYYNDNIIHIFINKAMTIKRKENEINIEAKREKDKVISQIKYGDNLITIKLINSYRHSGNIYNLNIMPKSYFEIKFKKSVDLETVIKVSDRIDSVIHLFLFSNNRNKELTLYDTKKNSYEYHNLNLKNKDEKKPTFYLDKRENNIDNFTKLFDLFINIDENNSNSLFPFFNYNRGISSIEIQFLEYYKTLEYTDMESQKKKGKGKNNRFLLQLLKKYTKVKNVYFGTIQDEVVEAEIRSLRNYYSHNGYYLTDLPIPTDKPNYYKKVDVQWIYNVKMFIKTIAYLEVYTLANIVVDEDYLMTHLK